MTPEIQPTRDWLLERVEKLELEVADLKGQVATLLAAREAPSKGRSELPGVYAHPNGDRFHSDGKPSFGRPRVEAMTPETREIFETDRTGLSGAEALR